MLSAIADYLPFFTAFLLLALVLLAFRLVSAVLDLQQGISVLSQQLNELNGYIAEQTKTFDATKNNIELSLDVLNSVHIDLHALAAHFVPRIRTERDISDEYYHEEKSSHGLDAASRFYKGLKE